MLHYTNVWAVRQRPITLLVHVASQLVPGFPVARDLVRRVVADETGTVDE